MSLHAFSDMSQVTKCKNMHVVTSETDWFNYLRIRQAQSSRQACLFGLLTAQTRDCFDCLFIEVLVGVDVGGIYMSNKSDHAGQQEPRKQSHSVFTNWNNLPLLIATTVQQ